MAGWTSKDAEWIEWDGSLKVKNKIEADKIQANEFVGVAESLGDLTDVDITGVSTGDFLQKSATDWVDFDLLAASNTWTGVNTFQNANAPLLIKGTNESQELLKLYRNTTTPSITFARRVATGVPFIEGDEQAIAIGQEDLGAYAYFNDNKVSLIGGVEVQSFTSAGFVKNSAAGLLSGGNSIDISSDTNLSATAPLKLTGDQLSLDTSANITWTGINTFQRGTGNVVIDATTTPTNNALQMKYNGTSTLYLGHIATVPALLGATNVAAIGQANFAAYETFSGGTATTVGAVVHQGTVTNTSSTTMQGDLAFSGDSAGLSYGACYGNSIAWSQAAAQNTWYNISDSDMGDGQLHNVTHDGSGKLTVGTTGRYLIMYNLTIKSGTANTYIEAGIERDGSGSANVIGQAHADVVTANKYIHLGGQAIFDCSGSNYFEVAVRTTDAGNPTLTVDDLNIALVLIGGT